MGFSFIDIEEKRSRLIWILFLFIIVFYFFLTWLLYIPLRLILLIVIEKLKNTIITLPLLPSIEETILIFIVAAVVGIIYWFRSVNHIIDKILEQIGANPLDRNDSFHCQFKDVVQEASIAAGGKEIEIRIIPTSSINAFALSDFDNRSVIGVTEGLLGKLNRDQLEAVVGHELAHILSGDCTTTTIASSIFGIYSAMMDKTRKLLSLPEENGFPLGYSSLEIFFLLWFIYIAIGITQIASLFLNLFISRHREYRADAIAVRLTRNPLALAEALYLISRGWRGFNLGCEWLSNIFIVSPEYSELDESEGILSDLFSTHPPLRKRMRILLDMAHLDEKSMIQTLKGKLSASPRLPSAVLKKTTSGINCVFLENMVSNTLQSKEKITKGLSCPKCMAPLVEVFYEGAPVLRCSQCGGYLIHKDKIIRILTREEQEFSSYVIIMGQIIQKSTQRTQFNEKNQYLRSVFELTCPKCSNKMKRQFYTLVYPVEVDVCSKCSLTWFDKDELEILQFLIEDASKENK